MLSFRLLATKIRFDISISGRGRVVLLFICSVFHVYFSGFVGCSLFIVIALMDLVIARPKLVRDLSRSLIHPVQRRTHPKMAKFCVTLRKLPSEQHREKQRQYLHITVIFIPGISHTELSCACCDFNVSIRRFGAISHCVIIASYMQLCVMHLCKTLANHKIAHKLCKKICSTFVFSFVSRLPRLLAPDVPKKAVINTYLWILSAHKLGKKQKDPKQEEARASRFAKSTLSEQ